MTRSFFKGGYYPALVEGSVSGYFLEFFGWNQRYQLEGMEEREEKKGGITRLYNQVILGPILVANAIANEAVGDYRENGIEVVTFGDKSPPEFKGITNVDQAKSIVAAMRRKSEEVVDRIWEM